MGGIWQTCQLSQGCLCQCLDVDGVETKKRAIHLLIIDLGGVFIHFSYINDLSEEQEVTGSVQSMNRMTLTHGNMTDA